jgi:hypothetical protein
MFQCRAVSLRSMIVISRTTSALLKMIFHNVGTWSSSDEPSYPRRKQASITKCVNLRTLIWNVLKENFEILKHDMHSHGCIFTESSECDKDLIEKMERWHISQIQLILQQKDLVEHFSNFQNLYKIFRFVTNPHNT